MADQITRSTTRLAGLKVLIVDDDILLAVELIEELEELGAIPIGPMPSLEEAIAAIYDQAIDAAMLSVDLHGDTSLPVAKALLERGVPFVFVTGDDGFVREHFPDVPAHREPYDMAAIVDSLERLLTPVEKDAMAEQL